MDVEHVHPRARKAADDRRGGGPIVAELLAFLGEPLGEHVFGEVRRSIERCAREIEDRGWAENRHLDDADLIIPSDQLRYNISGDPLHRGG